MRTADEILEDARRLPVAERKRLAKALEEELSLEPATEKQEAKRVAGYKSLLAIAGSLHSEHTDVSADKYKHLAELHADDHERPEDK